ncbi:MAG: SusD/RagB family nutrient-binding outer membrane lipoprotein [Cyclobacteriaceae bacterium]
MKINFKNIFVILLFSLCVAIGCTSHFDEMNTDPNNPTEIGAQFLLPYAIERSVDRYWGHRDRFERINLDAAELWIQHLTRNIYSNEGDNYGISPALPNNNWKGFYNDAAINFQRIVLQSAEDGISPNSNYEGVGLVMRSWVFSLLTDMFGAIPYTEALSGSVDVPIYSPAYDSQEDVYMGLLADLKLANEKLSTSGPAILGDIFYEGNILKWKKFANSLRLRLANRIAAKKPTEARAIMAEILGDPATYPVFETVDDNASLWCTTVLPSNNEWHQVIVQSGRTDWNISKTLADKMNGLGDTRITVYASPNSEGQYQGHPNGLPDAIATTFLSSSSFIGSEFTKAEAPEVIMTLSELYFILAEAVLDGDISGDAQEYFEKGIEASYDQFGLDVPADFMTAVGAVTREKVLEQKWIALFGQGIEAWTEYRRTGYPVMPAADPSAVFENDGVLPTRFPYPATEYSLNQANVSMGESMNGGPNDMKTKLWWAE